MKVCIRVEVYDKHWWNRITRGKLNITATLEDILSFDLPATGAELIKSVLADVEKQGRVK